MKKAIALLLAIATILTLSACNKTKDENSSDTSLPTQSVTDKVEGPDSTDKETPSNTEETKQPTDSNTPNAGNKNQNSKTPSTGNKNQTTKPSENKPQTGNNGGSTGTTEGNKKPDTGNNDTKNNEFVTYQGVIFHDMHTGYLIGDYIRIGLKEKGNRDYDVEYIWQYGGGLSKVVPETVQTTLFFSQKLPKEYRKDLLLTIDNAMPEVVPSIDDTGFNKLFTPEYSKYFYKCMYNGELYLSVVEFESFVKFNSTSAKADQNGNLKFAEDIWVIGNGVDKKDSCAINLKDFKLSADKSTITATAINAKYTASVTLYKGENKWYDSDLAGLSAEEFAKMVTVVK